MLTVQRLEQPTMIESVGNLLAVKHGIVVHGCNAQGVMGSGVAKEVREVYPGAYEAYRNAYEKHLKETGQALQLGRVVWYTVSKEEPKLAIANAITQQFYGRDPKVRYVSYEAIETAFRRIGAIAREHNLPVHYPMIGAGLANGDWGTIADIIDRELEGVEHTVWTLPGFPTPSRGPKIR